MAARSLPRASCIGGLSYVRILVVVESELSVLLVILLRYCYRQIRFLNRSFTRFHGEKQSQSAVRYSLVSLKAAESVYFQTVMNAVVAFL